MLSQCRAIEFLTAVASGIIRLAVLVLVNGSQRSFQRSLKVPIAPMRSF
jgi:hypothetical protein